MKTLKFLPVLLITILLSCGDAKQNKPAETSNVDMVTEAMKDGLKTLSNLDELEKELKTEEEKRSQHSLSGYFKGNLNGNTLQFTQWNAAVSRGSLFDQRATFHFFINEENGETLSVTLSGKDLHSGNIITNYCPTMTPYKPMDADFMKKFSNGFASVSYINDATGTKWSSADGDVVIESVSANALKVRWKGKAFIGKWQDKNLVPFEGEANLSFNFISDLRNIQ